MTKAKDAVLLRLNRRKDRALLRESAVIEDVIPREYDTEDGFSRTISLAICFPPVFKQVFMGPKIHRDESVSLFRAYDDALCDTFGVNSVSNLKFERCYVLRSFPHYSSEIQGIESARTGQRFIVLDWERTHLRRYPQSPLLDRKLAIAARILKLEKELAGARSEARECADLYFEWSRL